MDIKILKEAALKFGTPIYLYDLKIIKNQFDKLNKELSVLENYKIHFAAKSLSNISVLKYIKKMGAGLDAVSIEEVMIGLKCRFNKDEILYTPNGVSFEEIKEVFKLGVKINLDSIESIKDFVNEFGNQPITVRINPGIYAGGNDNVSVGHSESKFGIPEERIDELLDMEKKGKINITGLHIHTGSDITKSNQFKEGIKKIFSIARDFKNIESIDLGGGIKIPYYKDDTSTNLNDYVKEVSKELKTFELDFNKKLFDRFGENEITLLKTLSLWPRVIENSVIYKEPHRIVYYLIDLSGAFHNYWSKGNLDSKMRVINEQDIDLTAARLALLNCISKVIKLGLDILAVKPVEKMIFCYGPRERVRFF